MKHIFLAAASLALLAACDKPVDFPPAPAVPQTKTVNVSFAQSKDYSDPSYNAVEAELRLSIAKYEKATGATTVVWDTLVPFQSLRNYPAINAPWYLSKQITVTDDYRESVTASYSLRFRDAENRQTQEAKNVFALPGNSTLLFHVNL